MTRTVLVIPSNRPDCLAEWFKAWAPVKDWDDTVVVWDLPEVPHVNYEFPHYNLCWSDIKSPIFARKDSAIRWFGFHYVWALNKYDVTLTMDDDCRPYSPDWAATHVNNIFNQRRWVTTAGERTRGLPYSYLGVNPNIVASHGLWQGVPDYDAIVALHTNNKPLDNMPVGTQIMPSGCYFPMCGMNLAFKTSFTSAMYCPLQGEGSPYRRFDDIWCGIIAKKIADHMRLQFISGEPHIYHSKASDPFVNLVKEAPGIVMNEKFWLMVDEVDLRPATSQEDCIRLIGQNFLTKDDAYLKMIGEHMQEWAGLFE